MIGGNSYSELKYMQTFSYSSPVWGSSSYPRNFTWIFHPFCFLFRRPPITRHLLNSLTVLELSLPEPLESHPALSSYDPSPHNPPWAHSFTSLETWTLCATPSVCFPLTLTLLKKGHHSFFPVRERARTWSQQNRVLVSLCSSLAVWPWANHTTSLGLTVSSTKRRWQLLCHS